MQGHFHFFDLFSGIGGTRIAFERCGGRCIYSCEADPKAREVYFDNFGDMPKEDINNWEMEIPKRKPNVVVAGFPCQTFSMAGKRAGLNDERGQLFFTMANLIEKISPDAFFLENVKGILSHDKGKTFETIMKTLRSMEYYVPDPQIINAKNFGLPQNRERLFFVGFRRDHNINDFIFPTDNGSEKKVLRDIVEKGPVPIKNYLSEGYLKCLKDHKERQKKLGRGYGYCVKDLDEQSSTALVGGMGRERNLIVGAEPEDRTPTTHIRTPVNLENIRRLTPREFSRLQGFPSNFLFENIADTHAYRLFGNSVPIPAVESTAEKIIETLIEKRVIKKYVTRKKYKFYNDER